MPSSITVAEPTGCNHQYRHATWIEKAPINLHVLHEIPHLSRPHLNGSPPAKKPKCSLVSQLIVATPKELPESDASASMLGSFLSKLASAQGRGKTPETVLHLHRLSNPSKRITLVPIPSLMYADGSDFYLQARTLSPSGQFLQDYNLCLEFIVVPFSCACVHNKWAPWILRSSTERAGSLTNACGGAWGRKI